MTFAEIAPLTRLPKTTRSFTYQIPSQLEGIISIGQFVNIPWRKRIITGVIIEIHNRQPDFKKISSIDSTAEDTPSWNVQYIQSMIDCADFCFSSMATFMMGFAPPIPKKMHKISQAMIKPSTLPEMTVNKKVSEQITQITQDLPNHRYIKFQRHSERLLSYRQIAASIDEQILILTPQINEAEEIYGFLDKYFPGQVILWDNKANKNHKWNNWNKIKSNKSRIVIATRSGMFLPCLNLGAIIVDQADSEDHKSWDASPNYDVRECTKILAKHLKVPVQFFFQSAPLLSPDKDCTILKSSPAPLHTVFHNKPNPVFHESVTKIIKQTLESQSVVIVSTHKSKAKTLRCLDCQFQWRCSQCNTNLVITENSLKCPNCETSLSMPITCPDCNGQRIQHFGLGLEGIKNLYVQSFPNQTVAQITSEGNDIAQSSSPQLIFASSYVLKHLLLFPKINIGQVILHSPESTLFLPNYNANEKFYRFINWHRSIANDYLHSPLLVQTSLPEDDVVYNQVINDEYQAFIDLEKMARVSFSFPPYARIVKIRLKNTKDTFQEMSDKTTSVLKQQSQILSTLGPIFNRKENKIIDAVWIVKTSNTADLKLDKTLDFIYSEAVIDINPI